MKKTSNLLIVIVITVMFISQAMGSDKYLIFVHDRNDNYVQNAYVEIFEGSRRVDSGYTDNNGIFTSWLDQSIRYRVTARGNGQFGDWQGMPEGGRIDIYMNN
jgi:hypothetical protein